MKVKRKEYQEVFVLTVSAEELASLEYALDWDARDETIPLHEKICGAMDEAYIDYLDLGKPTNEDDED